MIRVSKMFIDAFYDSRKTQRKFAEDLGVAESRVSLFLRDKDRPTLSEIDRICKALGCEVQDVIKYEEE